MWLPQLLVDLHCKLPKHIYLRCGHVHILTCYDWCKMNSDIEFVWRFYQESVTYGQCVQDLCRASPVGEICSSSQEVLLSRIPRSPLFFFCSGYVLYNTYKSGKWWKMRKAWAYSSHEWCQVNVGGGAQPQKFEHRKPCVEIFLCHLLFSCISSYDPLLFSAASCDLESLNQTAEKVLFGTLSLKQAEWS